MRSEGSDLLRGSIGRYDVDGLLIICFSFWIIRGGEGSASAASSVEAWEDAELRCWVFLFRAISFAAAGSTLKIGGNVQ